MMKATTVRSAGRLFVFFLLSLNIHLIPITGVVTHETSATTAAAVGRGLPVDAMFILGDSLSDPGNNVHSSKPNIVKPPPPYSVDYLPGSGRCTNGRLAVDFLAEYLGFPSPPPNLQPNTNATHGLNFASVGATAGDGAIDYAIVLSEQLASFKSFKSAVLSSTTPNPNYPTSQVFSSALYIVLIGSNDYIALLRSLTASSSTSTERDIGRIQISAWDDVLHLVTSTPEAAAWLSSAEQRVRHSGVAGLPTQVFGAVKKTVDSVVAAVEELLKSGAHRLLVPGLPAFGCTPTMRQAFNLGPRQCSALVNTLFALHNQLLRRNIARLRRRYLSAVILEANTFNKLIQVARLPKSTGLAVTAAACCGAPLPYNAMTYCGGNYTYTNGTVAQSTLCPNRGDYFFFDYIHPTEAGHKQMANLLWDGSKAAIAPLSIKQLSKLKL